MARKRYNGGGSIYKMGGKVKRSKPWRVRVTIGWTDDGKQLFKDLGYFATRKDAENCLTEHHNNYQLDMNLYNITLSQVYEKWMKEFNHKVSDSSLKQHRTAFKHLTTLHNLPMMTIRRQHILDILTGHTVNVQKRILTTLRYLYHWSIVNDVNIKVNYAALIKPGDAPTIEAKTIDREIYTDDEIKELWKHEGKMYYDITLILLYSGMRISEILELNTENIDLANNIMVGGNKTEAGIDRDIPIHPKIKPIIQRYLSAGKPFLFYNSKGRPLSYKTCRENWKELPHFVNRTFHETRHTFITRLRKFKVDLNKIQMIVGHDNEKETIDIYTHIEFKELYDIVVKIDY